MANMINLKINNIDISVKEGTTILEAARQNGIDIPTLCFMKEINAIGACRVCVVEVKGARSLVTACVYPVNEGMEVFTNTKRVLDARKTTVELLLSNHNKSCLSCARNQNCELQKLSLELGCDPMKYEGEKTPSKFDDSTAYLVRDNSKCILCRRCVAVCKSRQSVSVIGANERGFATAIGAAFDTDLAEVACVGCGQCIVNCPTGALTEKSEIDDVISALSNPSKRVVVATAPAVRVALGEEFGFPIGTNVEGKMVTALKMLGFNDVFDIDFSADLTIMEEGFEFLDRIQNGGKLPLITSCSPGWIKYCEHYFPEFIPNLSSCKSPQQMFGAVVKTYYAEKLGVKPEDIYMVSVMPCTAKKFEKGRNGQSAAGVTDIDAVLTTRELAKLIKRNGIMFNDLKESTFDAPLGMGSGAGLIFGATGGVMEAALRTVVETLENKELDNLDFKEVRGVKGIKEATYNVAGMDVNVAVVSGLTNAKELLEMVKSGKKNYHFIEVMCCPGGCVNGGGQPIHSSSVVNNSDLRELRGKALYKSDKSMELRRSHKNPFIKQIYDEYFGKPNSHKAHEILHTTYEQRDKF